MTATTDRITLHLPDDFHHHCRDGNKTVQVLKHASKRFGRCLVMPNLKPPVVNMEMALKYREHVLKSLPPDSPLDFEPLMTIYLTDNTTPEIVEEAFATGKIVACKFYPAGATTNSDSGVSDVSNVYPAIAKMAEIGMILCIHSEVTHGDIFEREPAFINEVMKPLVERFPTLKIVMEHISTKEAVEYIMHEAPDNVRASVTVHHLLFNRNHMLVGGIRPHLYCLPILKAESHRVALLEAATSGSSKFFMGTDSAPHPTAEKQSACGCAGVFTAHAAVELYAEAFETVGKLDMLDDFLSKFGAEHYGLTRNTRMIVLEKKPWEVPLSYDFGDGLTVTPLRAGEKVQWQIVD